ncbi:Expansin-A13 [Bienertia sinuspersici]
MFGPCGFGNLDKAGYGKAVVGSSSSLFHIKSVVLALNFVVFRILEIVFLLLPFFSLLPIFALLIMLSLLMLVGVVIPLISTLFFLSKLLKRLLFGKLVIWLFNFECILFLLFLYLFLLILN